MANRLTEKGNVLSRIVFDIVVAIGLFVFVVMTLLFFFAGSKNGSLHIDYGIITGIISIILIVLLVKLTKAKSIQQSTAPVIGMKFAVVLACLVGIGFLVFVVLALSQL